MKLSSLFKVKTSPFRRAGIYIPIYIIAPGSWNEAELSYHINITG